MVKFFRTLAASVGNLTLMLDRKERRRRRRLRAVLALGIDRREIDAEMALDRSVGVADPSPGAVPVIVSLTSFPARIDEVKYTVHSLLRQSVRPWRVILWLGEEQFPQGEVGLPADLLKMRARGLEIRFTHDTRSYKKLIPALSVYPDCCIVTADDDIYYPPEWLRALCDGFRQHPHDVSAIRLHRICMDSAGKILPYGRWRQDIQEPGAYYCNFATGCGGILYPPHSLSEDVVQEHLFMADAPFADDVWFWAMALLKGTRINAVSFDQSSLRSVRPERDYGIVNEPMLYSTNIHQNDMQIRAVLRRYPQVEARLRSECMNPGEVCL